MANINIPSEDFVTTSLSGSLIAGATSATIGTGLDIPATNGVLEISYDSEVAAGSGLTNAPETIFYTAYNSGTGVISGLTRGMAGTDDVTHDNGQSVQGGMSTLHLTGELGSTVKTDADFVSNTSGSDVDVTGLSVTVTVPDGGRKVKITAFTPHLVGSGAAGSTVRLKIKEGATQLNETRFALPASSYGSQAECVYIGTPSAGSHTYKVAIYQSGVGNVTLTAAATTPAFILVEII